MAPKRKRQQDSPEPKKVKTSGIPSVDVLRSSLDSYSVLLKSRSQEHTNKPDELADLDTFVHDELPPRIDDGVSLDDFAKVIRWKLLVSIVLLLYPLLIDVRLYIYLYNIYMSSGGNFDRFFQCS